MKVMFDLSTFSDMVERQALDNRMASGTRAIAYASFTFLEELAPLRKKDEQNFNSILDHYSSLTWGRILLQAETGRPVTADDAVLPSEDHQGAINLLREGATAVDVVGQEVSQRKQRYEEGMNRAAESVRMYSVREGTARQRLRRASRSGFLRRRNTCRTGARYFVAPAQTARNFHT